LFPQNQKKKKKNALAFESVGIFDFLVIDCVGMKDRLWWEF